MPERPKQPEASAGASSSGWRSIERFGDCEWEPPIDVMASPDVAWIRIAAPGVAPKNLRVRVRGRMVSVGSRRVVRRPPRGCEFIRAEIPLGGFERRVELPWEPDPGALRIRALHGIVELVLPRDGAGTGALELEQEIEDGR